jgi:hypothetical protein
MALFRLTDLYPIVHSPPTSGSQNYDITPCQGENQYPKTAQIRKTGGPFV